MEVVGLFVTLYTDPHHFPPNYLQLISFLFFLRSNAHFFDWGSLVVQHLHDSFHITHKVCKRLMLYIRINDTICNVSIVNIEEHEYALLSRLFWKPYLHLVLQTQNTFLVHVIQFICFHLHSSEYQPFVQIYRMRIILKWKDLKYGGGDELGGFMSKENYPGGHHPVHLRFIVGINI